uniref:Trithorax group protein osa n=1 Tax=Panagrellus redivivus TaxID=6233 RepID=A0A7E4W114_PANRE
MNGYGYQPASDLNPYHKAPVRNANGYDGDARQLLHVRAQQQLLPQGLPPNDPRLPPPQNPPGMCYDADQSSHVRAPQLPSQKFAYQEYQQRQTGPMNQQSQFCAPNSNNAGQSNHTAHWNQAGPFAYQERQPEPLNQQQNPCSGRDPTQMNYNTGIPSRASTAFSDPTPVRQCEFHEHRKEPMNRQNPYSGQVLPSWYVNKASQSSHVNSVKLSPLFGGQFRYQERQNTSSPMSQQRQIRGWVTTGSPSNPKICPVVASKGRVPPDQVSAQQPVPGEFLTLLKEDEDDETEPAKPQNPYPFAEQYEHQQRQNAMMKPQNLLCGHNPGGDKSSCISAPVEVPKRPWWDDADVPSTNTAPTAPLTINFGNYKWEMVLSEGGDQSSQSNAPEQFPIVTLRMLPMNTPPTAPTPPNKLPAPTRPIFRPDYARPSVLRPRPEPKLLPAPPGASLTTTPPRTVVSSDLNVVAQQAFLKDRTVPTVPNPLIIRSARPNSTTGTTLASKRKTARRNSITTIVKPPKRRKTRRNSIAATTTARPNSVTGIKKLPNPEVDLHNPFIEAEPDLQNSADVTTSPSREPTPPRKNARRTSKIVEEMRARWTCISTSVPTTKQEIRRMHEIPPVKDTPADRFNNLIADLHRFEPVIPDAASRYILTRHGISPAPENEICTRLLGVAAQKVVTDILADAITVSRKCGLGQRTRGKKEVKHTLTETLINEVLGELGDL